MPCSDTPACLRGCIETKMGLNRTRQINLNGGNAIETKFNKTVYIPVVLIILLALTAVVPVVNAQSETTTVNAQSVDLNRSWWTEGSNASVATYTVSPLAPNEALSDQIYANKLNYLRSIKAQINDKSKKQTDGLQTLSSSSAMGLITIPFNYNYVGFDIADSIAGSYYGGGDALKGTSDTLSNAMDYWKNDQYLCYYTNMGESNGDEQHHCNDLYFNDGNGLNPNVNSVLVSASTIQSISPDYGIRWADMFIDSCYSNNDPMFSAFGDHYPNWYIGTTTDVPATTTMQVTQHFWDHYSGDGNPQTDLSNACTAYSESTTDYQLHYYGWW